MKALSFREAMFTTHQAEGALPNGTRVEKTEHEPSDTHRIGAKAIVLGSLGPIPYEGLPGVYGYFVEWDDMPGVSVLVISTRVREIKPN